MTTDDIKKRLVRIAAAALAGDHEAAHGHEDELFVDVLWAVAEGKAGLVEARAALGSRELEFSRRRA